MGCGWAEEQLVIQPELLISLFNQAKTEDLRMNPSTSHSLHGWMWVEQRQRMNSRLWIKSSVPSFFSAEFNPWDTLQADWLQWTMIIHA